MRTAILTYNEVESLPSTLVFDTPSSALMWERVEYLHATTPDQTTPIVFTSSDEDVLRVELKNSFWQVEYCGPGTATITASQTGQTSVIKSVTVSEKPAPTGRVINVGTGSGTINITLTGLSLIPGDTVIIAAGDYTGVNITDILIADGNEPVTIITDGLVRLVNENSFQFKNLRNVIIDGCRVPVIKQALLVDGHNYIGVYWNNLNNVEIWGVELRNVYNSAWFQELNGVHVPYNAADPNSYQKNVKFYNCKSDNAGGFNTSGNINVNDTDKILNLVVDFEFIGWEACNTSAGSIFFIGAGQNIIFKDCILDHINTLSNNHNGILFVRGHSDVINCRITNFEGNIIRVWPFSIDDGGVLDLGPRTCKFYGNIIFTSRKYSAFEGQGFANFYETDFTTYCNIDIFNNTCGNMNQNNDPTIFTGTVYDNYELYDGIARLFNNILINPVKLSSNNIYLTYPSVAVGGTETQTGNQQEWNNRVYYTLDSSKVNPGNLAPKVAQSGKTRAINNSATVVYTEDIYGNENVDNIGAVQCADISLPVIVDPPTVPDIGKNILSAWSTQPAPAFMIDAKASFSTIGVKNYDIERNGVVRTSHGGYCRDGRADPEYPSDLLAWTAYTYRWRARDWRDQVSDWSTPQTFATQPIVSEIDHATAPTLIRISGGTLVNNTGYYTATGSTVLFDTSIVIPAGYSARLIIGYDLAQGVLGWATTAAITNIADIHSGISTNAANDKFEGVTGLTRIEQRDINPGDLISLFISYQGDSWCERSDDNGKSWYKPGNSLTTRFFLGGNYTGAKYIVGYIPTDRRLTNPLIVLHPTPYNA